MSVSFLRIRGPIILRLGLFFLLATVPCFSEAGGINYNTYYRFPLSVGVEHRGESPLAADGTRCNSFDIAMVLRWPVSSLPVLQPA
jgi:hypothetical protein